MSWRAKRAKARSANERDCSSVLKDIDETCERCRTRKDAQQVRLDEIRRQFPELEVLTLPELQSEVEGPADLQGFAARLAPQ